MVLILVIHRYLSQNIFKEAKRTMSFAVVPHSKLKATFLPNAKLKASFLRLRSQGWNAASTYNRMTLSVKLSSRLYSSVAWC